MSAVDERQEEVDLAVALVVAQKDAEALAITLRRIAKQHTDQLGLGYFKASKHKQGIRVTRVGTSLIEIE